MSEAPRLVGTPPTLATKRVNRGRGHSYLLDGSETDGVTTVLDNGVPKPALVGWAFNTVRDFAIDNWNELSGLSLSERVNQINKSRYATRDAAANKGTQVHSLAHRLMADEEVDVPEELTGHVDAYLAFDKEWEPKENLAEVVIINRAYGYMGTLDLIAELADGHTWLLDWKTGGKGVYSEVALQLAAYRNAETYIGPDLHEHPMPEVDRCGVVWLRADGYDLYPVDASPETFRVFLYAQQIAKWREKQEKGEPAIGEALER